MTNFGRNRIILLLVLAGGVLFRGFLPAAGSAPQAVSPGAQEGVSVVEARCSTFSWGFSGEPEGYELVVYQLAEEGSLEMAEPVLQQGLPGSARSWTPSLDRCLTPGRRYAWLVRAVSGEKAGEWSVPRLFEVAAGSSLAEVEEALALLRRYVKAAQRAEGAPGVEEEAGSLPLKGDRLDLAGLLGRNDLEASRGPSTDTPLAQAPFLSSASLTVDQQVHLAAGSSVFKNGSLFLWSDDGSANLALGKDALSSNGTGAGNTATGAVALFANTTGFSNTAHGFSALFANTAGFRNTAIGNRALFLNNGSYNTASGFRALFSNTEGSRNTASGYKALFSNTSGNRNTASGFEELALNTASLNTAIGGQALSANTTGSRNIGVGYRAGAFNAAGSDNIWIGSSGSGAGESNTLRIGQGTGTATFRQNRAFISGIRGITTGNANGLTVLIDSAGQLGTVNSSRRVKEDIRDMGEASSELQQLRPVTFRYKRAFADGNKPRQFGLIAEEVAETFPELVVYDAEGRPETIKYHLLSSLLLNEVKKLHWELQRLKARQEEFNVLRDRLVRLEAGETAQGRPVKNARR